MGNLQVSMPIPLPPKEIVNDQSDGWKNIIHSYGIMCDLEMLSLLPSLWPYAHKILILPPLN